MDALIERGAQCVVISGDSTDHALDVHSPAVGALARQVRRLAEHCPVLMLQGTYSHEPPGTLDVFGCMGAKHPVYIADRICQVALVDGRWVASERWRFERVPAGAQLLVSCLPTLNKCAVAAAVGATEADWAVGEHIAAVLRGFSPINEEARAAGVPTLGVSHGTVNGCVTEHGVPMAGLDHEFTTGSLFAAGASAFLLGHIHKHQGWRDGRRLIAYPGSIGRLHYGEQGAKGCLVWDVDADGAEFEFIETPARRTLELDFDGPPDMDRLRAAVEQAQGAFVRVRWTVPEDGRDSVDRGAIAAALDGAAEVKLEARIIPAERTRAAGIGTAVTLEEKVQRWADSVGVSAEPLIERLRLLQWDESEAIATAILNDRASEMEEARSTQEA
ncbi:MAG TPA: metallophosphatase family protein [Burkholderiales bacterium]|nr:metallophosphatase family protein [Burkholderiales bacterium]